MRYESSQQDPLGSNVVTSAASSRAWHAPAMILHLSLVTSVCADPLSMLFVPLGRLHYRALRKPAALSSLSGAGCTIEPCVSQPLSSLSGAGCTIEPCISRLHYRALRELLTRWLAPGACAARADG